MALGQPLFYLATTGGALSGGGYEPGLVPAGVATVARMPTAVAVAVNLRAAAFGACVLSRYHQPHTNPILT